MKNVALFLPTLNDGGAEGVVKEYALRLDRAKYNVVVVTVQSWLYEASSLYNVIKEAGIRLIDIYPHNIPLLYRLNPATRIWHKFFDTAYVGLRLKKILKDERIDILHSHMRVLHYLKPIASDLRNIKLFYTCHSLPERWLGKTNKNEFNAARYLIDNNNLKIIALHEEMAAELNSMFHINNTIVLYNGADYELFSKVSQSKENLRREYNIPIDAFVLGHVGHFVDSKNHAFILKVFEELYKRNKKAFLLLIGHGSQQIIDSVNAIAREKGFKENLLILSHRRDVPELMKTMDAFIFPSKFEGFGIVAIEAQMAGLRCVFSENVPSVTILTSNTFSLSLKENIEKWCDYLTDSSLHNEHHGNIAEFDLHNIILKLEGIYDE